MKNIKNSNATLYCNFSPRFFKTCYSAGGPQSSLELPILLLDTWCLISYGHTTFSPLGLTISEIISAQSEKGPGLDWQLTGSGFASHVA